MIDSLIYFFKNDLKGFNYFIYIVIILLIIVWLLKYIINLLDASSKEEEFLGSKKDIYQKNTTLKDENKVKVDDILVIRDETNKKEN